MVWKSLWGLEIPQGGEVADKGDWKFLKYFKPLFFPGNVSFALGIAPRKNQPTSKSHG